MSAALARWSILFEMELKSMRDSWAWSLGLASLYPLSLLFFIKYGGRPSGWDAGLYAVPGCMVTAVVLNTTLGLGQELSVIRETASLDFYATLPIKKSELVLAILARSVLFALPAAAMAALVGSWAFELNLSRVSWLIVPTLLLSCLTLAGLGALIGFHAPSARAASVMTQAAYMIIAFFSPVMYPLEALPPGLQVLARFLPTTYAADALRLLTAGAPLGRAYLADVAFLALFAAASYALISRRLRWRID